MKNYFGEGWGGEWHTYAEQSAELTPEFPSMTIRAATQLQSPTEFLQEGGEALMSGRGGGVRGHGGK